MANQSQRPPKKEKISERPKTLFEEKKEWQRSELRERFKKASPFLPGGMLTQREREKLLDELFPSGRFQTHISETEAKTRLRELRSQEYWAKTWAEKSRIKKQREFLEREFGLKGKY